MKYATYFAMEVGILEVQKNQDDVGITLESKKSPFVVIPRLLSTSIVKQYWRKSLYNVILKFSAKHSLILRSVNAVLAKRPNSNGKIAVWAV